MSKSNFYFKEDSLGKIPFVELGYKSGDLKLSIKVAVKDGNNMFSYIINDNETIFYDPSLPMTSFAVGNPLLFPFPNRIEDAMWTWKGKSYLQKKDGIPIQLHSLIYDEKSFKYETPIVNEDSIRLKTFIEVDENHPIYKGYPYCFKLSFDFVLSKKGLTIEYMLENYSDKQMPFGIGFHPYFKRLSGQNNTKIKVPSKYHYELRTDAEPEFFNKIPSGIGMIANVMPTGNLLDVADTEFDLLDFKEIGSLDLDTVYTNLDKNPYAFIDYKSKGLKLEISSTEEFKHYVVYVPKDKSFFCIEPQTCSTDAINLYDKGIDHVGLLTCPSKEAKEGLVSINFEIY